jgi:hypothetical protein
MECKSASIARREGKLKSSLQLILRGSGETLDCVLAPLEALTLSL